MSDEAYKAGHERGHAFATWVEIPDAQTAQEILEGYEDGEPDIMDMQPAPLSGEWAGESIPELSAATGIDLADGDNAESFEDGFADGYWSEVLRVAREVMS